MKPKEFEVFLDHSYYDMWAVRPAGMRDFEHTLHFKTEDEAMYVVQCIKWWYETEPEQVDEELGY